MRVTNKKKWVIPKLSRLKIKLETAVVIKHKKETSPNWS